MGRDEHAAQLSAWLDHLDVNGRWALLKFLGGAARVGVSARLAKLAVAEAFAIRSVLYYAATGAAVTSLLYFSATGWSTLALAVDGFARRELEIIAAAGIVAGLVYWAIAGRHAGRWGVSSGGRTGA